MFIFTGSFFNKLLKFMFLLPYIPSAASHSAPMPAQAQGRPWCLWVPTEPSCLP